jgi:ketosteroid isomerase-like protein
MSQENVEVVRRVFEARNQGDIEAVLACATPDVVIDFSGSTGPWAGIYRGEEGIRRNWGVLAEAFDQFRWEAEEYIDAGDAVVVPARFYSRGRESGVETVSRGAQVYWLTSGKIMRYRQCQDRAEALEAVGLSE